EILEQGHGGLPGSLWRRREPAEVRAIRAAAGGEEEQGVAQVLALDGRRVLTRSRGEVPGRVEAHGEARLGASGASSPLHGAGLADLFELEARQTAPRGVARDARE